MAGEERFEELRARRATAIRLVDEFVVGKAAEGYSSWAGGL